MSEVMLSLERLNKIYGGTVHAVKDFDMTVNRGEIVALSRFFRLRQDINPSHDLGFRGSDERDRAESRAERCTTCLLPSVMSRWLLKATRSTHRLTVAENIGFRFAFRRDLASRRSTHRVGEMAKLLDVESILDRYPTSISGGQQQRASLGRALIREADLYLARRADGPAGTPTSCRSSRSDQALPERAQSHDDPGHPRSDRGQCVGR